MQTFGKAGGQRRIKLYAKEQQALDKAAVIADEIAVLMPSESRIGVYARNAVTEIDKLLSAINEQGKAHEQGGQTTDPLEGGDFVDRFDQENPEDGELLS